MMSCSFLSFQRWKAHIRFNQNVTPCNNDCSRPTQETFIDGIVPATSGCLGGWVIPISDCFNHTFNDFHEPEYVQTIHERKDDKVRDLERRPHHNEEGFAVYKYLDEQQANQDDTRDSESDREPT
mmetsp:Transcript_22305/g.67834  ORF Transcript_22305/g.67834 Transcript_22305/m.67834 type:complete len:125 (+) Transcript_22305:453-827(+)